MKRVLYWSKPSAYQIPFSNLYFNGQIINGQFNFLENSMIDSSEISYGCSHVDFPNQGPWSRALWYQCLIIPVITRHSWALVHII